MIICDIDGCIFDNTHRAHLVPKDKNHTPHWTAFNQACADDKPVMAVIKFVKFLARMADLKQHRQITFITSRGENVREQTAKQLYSQFAAFDCKLIMRPMNDHRDTIDYKRDVFSKLINQLSDNFLNNEQITLLDDHPCIVKMVKVNFPQINPILVPSFDCTVVNTSNGDYVVDKKVA